MNKSKIFSIIFLLFWSVSIANAGKYSFDFLSSGIGTRAKALGASFTSIADDGSALLWNPAGTCLFPSSQFYFTHNSNFSSMSSVDLISFTKPIVGKSAVSVAILRHGVSDIPIFPQLEGTPEERDTTPSMQGDGNPLGYFSESANIYYVNVSKQLNLRKAKFLLGGNFKYFNESLWGYSGTGIGTDFGGIFVFPRLKLPGILSIGINIEDAFGTQILWNTESQSKDNIPTNYRFGFNYFTSLNKIKSGIMLSFDYNFRYEGSKHFGIEYSYKNNFILDTGWNKGTLSFGTGFKFWKIAIQYAFISQTLGSSHSVSMGFTL